MVYTFINPKVALMGPGSVKEIGKYALELGGTKALIVSGKSRHGQDLAEDIQKILEAGGVKSINLCRGRSQSN